MIILGIETSCDDTSVAIVRNGCDVLANCVANQDVFHRKFGGVVPEIAARKHLENLLPTLQTALDLASIGMSDVDAFAVTHRPGLIGSLVIGLTAAKTLAAVFSKPLIALNHIEAHAYAACFTGMQYGAKSISLIASGGHTSILHLEADRLSLIGRTIDDAAGEAFDKVAKSIGLGYPGGPIIDRLSREGNPNSIRFPRPMLDHPNLDFSFSGLKTAVLYHLHHHPDTAPEDLSASFQAAVVDVLVEKTLRAAKLLEINTIAVVGGVACNAALRKAFASKCERSGKQLFIPAPQFCTDNAAMVAGLAYHKHIAGMRSSISIAAHSSVGFEPEPIQLDASED